MKKTKRRLGKGIVAAVVCIAVIGAIAYYNKAHPSGSSSGEEKQNSVKKFSDYYYCEVDRENRYADFGEENPKLGAGDVVWMVNVDLDMDDYENTKEIDNPADPMVLVNKHYALSDSYEPDDLESVGNNQKMTSAAASAYTEIEDAARAAGLPFKPQSGFRSYETQSYIYENNKTNDPDGVDAYSARPGYSEHQTGLAIDVNIPGGGGLRDFVGTDEAQWVSSNAYKYGFIVRYTEDNSEITGYMAEPWHLRFVGREHAKKMKEENIESFEEYLVKFVYHRDD